MELSIGFDKDFEKTLKRLKKKYGEKMTELNGLSDKRLDYTKSIKYFMDNSTNAADSTIDPSANTGHKDVTTLEHELFKPHFKLMAFHKMFVETKKKYGLKSANEWAEGEWNGQSYLHDFPSVTLKPYCFAYDLKPIVEKGLFFVNRFNAQAPKHLVTYTDFVGEAVSWLSNRTSGAVGLPNFLVYSYYFWKQDCKNGCYSKSPEYYRDQEFQRIIYKLNQPYLRVTESAFTNFSIFDRPYSETLFGGVIYPNGDYFIDDVDGFIEYEKAFMEQVSKIRAENVMTYPVLSYALLRIDGKWEDEEMAKWCCRHNMKWGDSNFFVSKDVTSLSNCCRLVNSIKDIGYFNSIGGTALEVGSVKVNTINLARIAYETKDSKKYLKLLKKRVITCVKTLDVVRDIISRNIEKGLLPNYSLELMHITSQYNTIGINALWEAATYLGYTTVDEFGDHKYTEEGIEFVNQVLQTINDTKDAFIKDNGITYQINIEQVPAERCATVLMEKDKQLFKDGCYELPMYGNQWIPLGVKTSIYNKISCSSTLDKACNGGSIQHINCDAPFNNFDMAWDLLNKIADMDVPYFAFCFKISACENNHGFYGDICPKCGGKKVTTYQRIVGFLTPELNYSKERKEEFKMRDWFTLEQMKEL